MVAHSGEYEHECDSRRVLLWDLVFQGVLSFGGHSRGTMHYSIPKEGGLHDRSGAIKGDWNCTKCGAHNFKRRDYCFKCSTSREEADQIRLGEGYDEVSSTPCNTLLFRNLDVLTTEEKILAVLQEITALPIKNIRIAKDTLTNTSRGFCYVELNSTNEAVQLHDQLSSVGAPLYVDLKAVSLSYAKQSLSSLVSASSASVASTAVAAAQWTNQAPVQNYAGTPQYGQYGQDYSTYSNYNQNYDSTYGQNYNRTYDENYTNYQYDQYGYNQGKGDSSSGTGKTSIPASAADTRSATHSSEQKQESYGSSNANSSAFMGKPTLSSSQDSSEAAETDPPKYPHPDVSTYQYDESSGYYYDTATGLYYDPSSQYYYNAEQQKFLYWDGEKQAYLPAPFNSSSDDGGGTPLEKKSKEKDKQDKVKIAKKIAKDMEKWAKTLNQKKEIAKQGIVANQYALIDNSRQSATADAGFAMLEKKASLVERQQAVFEVMKKELEDKKLMPPPGSSKGKLDKSGGLVAAYGGGSDSDEDDEESARTEELRFTDWTKMACLLCKRQFPNKEALQRHQQLSDLHKQNLEAWRRARAAEGEAKYRDRAKERREKYGEPDPPHPNRLKEKYLKQKSVSYEEPTKEGIGSDNIGNKMLKAMGWSEGQGLGKSNQGRTEIVEAQRRTAAAGLGMKGSTYGATAGNSYKETVKKMMQSRYNELS